MPARHKSLRDGLLLESRFHLKALVDERGCRRDIRSNGWIVFSKASVFSDADPAEEKFFFARCGTLKLRNFTGRSFGLEVKSGPDVFADALVHKARQLCRRLAFPKILTALAANVRTQSRGSALLRFFRPHRFLGAA
jgi:hypothetical protein